MRIWILILLLVLTSIKGFTQSITDVDGNIYNSITIGNQTWMKENLKTTRFNDGEHIPKIIDQTEWGNLSSAAYCWYDNDSLNYFNLYGALYNWYCIDTDKLCPTGWVIPRVEDYLELVNYLGGDEIAGGKMKEIGTVHWTDPNEGATNQSGFCGLPSGLRIKNQFRFVGESTSFWTDFGDANSKGQFFDLNYNTSKSYLHVDGYKYFGVSVRCIKDNGVTSTRENLFYNLKIFPNPAKDWISVKSDDAIKEDIEILDLQGKCVLIAKKGTKKIDVSELSRGIYLARTIQGGKVYQSKLIIQ